MASGRFLAIMIADPLCKAGGVLAPVGGALHWAAAPDIISLTILAAGLVLLLVGGRRAFLLARVAREGREALAHVIGVEPSWPFPLHYVFRDSDGREVTGRYLLSREEALRWRTGDTGKVRYDPRNSARHVWVVPGSDEALLEALDKPREQLDAGGKIEIARAALEVGHLDYARQLLGEVAERDGERQEEARRLLEGRQLGSARAEAPTAGGSARPDITRAMLKRRVVFGGAGDLYNTTFLGVGLLMALAMLASLQSLVPPIIVVGVGAFLGVAAFVIHLVRQAIRNAQRMRNVLERGIVTQASVIGIDEARMRRGLFSQSLGGWNISYSYKDRRGNLHMGQSSHLSRKQAMRYRLGDSCEVVFDPDEPESSFWISRD